MKTLYIVFLSFFVFFVALSVNAFADHRDIVEKFTEASKDGNYQMMRFIVEHDEREIPGVVDTLIKDALAKGVSQEERDAKLSIGEIIAARYKDLGGDFEPLLKVKREIFETKLPAPVMPIITGKVHIVETISTDKQKNVFSPGNIVIRQGETVKWVNKDSIAHLLASFAVIGRKGLFSPRFEPGEDWSYEFTKTGEYYYVCFIHKMMYGKVTVVKPAP